MKILASGMSGLVGSALLPVLIAEGHSVTRLKSTRGAVASYGATEKHSQADIPWNPLQPIDPTQLDGFDAVIHLAGENVFGRWTAVKKVAIRDSRVVGTHHLCEALARTHKPGVLISASAIGFYGNVHGDESLTEESPGQDDFFGRLARDWELATMPAKQAGWRVVNLRIGIVLGQNGGALAKMLTPFRLGLGGKIGNGKQWLSWIAIEDAVNAILYCLHAHSISGPVNLAAPNPVTNAEFTRTLARRLRRPAFATVPAFAAKLLFGKEMAEETVLASQRVYPEKLLDSGFQFRFPELDSALANLMKSR